MMNNITILISLFLLLTCAPAVVYSVEFSVPPTVYKQAPSSTYQLSETAYRQLQPIQKHISAERYDEAFSALNRLVKRHEQRPYVVSVAMKTAAYIYITQQEYPKAIEWMQKILKLEGMSAQELQTIRHDLSQLQLQAEQYQGAITTMEHWLKGAEKSQVTAADYQLLAVSHFQLGRYTQSKQAALKGLQQHKPLVEPLYQLILACDFALKNYTSADNILSTLVKLNPSKKNYWIQWAGVLDLLDKPDKALVMFELMDKRKMLTNEQERIQFVHRLMQQNNAYKAASKLKIYIEVEEVETSIGNQLLLALAWENSGESNKATAILKPIEKNNKALTQLARIYINENQWQALVELLESKLPPPINEASEPLYLQLGYAYYQLEIFNKAENIFLMLSTSKQSSKETKASAKQWLKYLIEL